jgi:hypothetical protein
MLCALWNWTIGHLSSRISVETHNASSLGKGETSGLSREDIMRCRIAVWPFHTGFEGTRQRCARAIRRDVYAKRQWHRHRTSSNMDVGVCLTFGNRIPHPYPGCQDAHCLCKVCSSDKRLPQTGSSWQGDEVNSRSRHHRARCERVAVRQTRGEEREVTGRRRECVSCQRT